MKTGSYANSWLIYPSLSWFELPKQRNQERSRLLLKVLHACCRSCDRLVRNAALVVAPESSTADLGLARLIANFASVREGNKKLLA
jgi:hypothetical protein